MTIQANMHEAKSNLSQLADKAVSGEIIIIAKAGKPYVQLVPINQQDRVPGGFEDFSYKPNFKGIAPQRNTSLFHYPLRLY
ncbi:type II toxin-antitoxin system Phd/YefM family antitoxin [Photorhabdus sp. CRCIA-P01]|uniref:type II toxin-antitoxin system Phd/YefM family antitoxin n=1 Tax=Photorhabdus sp. CRCIA-P01 TaxID=2019570 RepID=UPI000E59E0E8|nr:type II toxin-antitoxin system prevent-host-death family antitoxin [Photorhabdus sp. CRCIA-P01]